MSFLKKQLAKSVESFFGDKKDFENYLFVLKKYWEKDTEGTLEALGKEIEVHELTESSLPYYRLWVEQLADMGDKPSLALLQKHFLKVSQVVEEKKSWQALRGLVHLELDEVRSCSHLFELLEKSHENPYALEFCEKYQRRLAEDGREPLFLCETTKPILDYFHWNTFSQSLLITGDFSLLDKVLSSVEKSFAKAPLKKEFSFYKALDERNFSEAKKEIQPLLKDYPRREDYQFLYAYTLSSLEEYKKSNAILEKILAKGRHDKDPDFYSLLGHNSYLSSFGDVNSSHWKRAVEAFLKAEENLSLRGLPTKEPLLNLSLMARYEKETSKDLSSQRKNFSYWFMKLKPSSFSRLMSSSEKEIFNLSEKIGASPREGDLVFLGSEENLSGSPRLGAVYQVLSTPIWDHTEGYESHLELVARFDRSLNLSEGFGLQASEFFQDEKKVFKRTPGRGCYLLSGKGLGQISKEIFDQIEDKKMTKALQALSLKAV